MMNSDVCPKCKKGLIRRKTNINIDYWSVTCLWCGHQFKKKKMYSAKGDKNE